MVDEAAFLSHARAQEATQQGWFSAEIAPVEYRERKEVRVMDRDEGIRPETTMASLGGLKPAFGKDGVLTAGNSSQLSDGAAALVLASGDAVKRLGLKPLARLARGAWSAGPSWRFIEAPIAAVERVQKQLGWSVSDIDLFENNEAFALSSVLFRKKLGVPYEKLNIHGGGIALGHPIGCSGARIIVTLVHALARLGQTRGLASLCHGTGGGTAVAVERV